MQHVTPPEVIEQALDKLEIVQSDVFLDIGCGDGRTVIHAAKTFKCRAVGIEIEPARAAEARENARRAGVGVSGKPFRSQHTDYCIVLST